MIEPGELPRAAHSAEIAVLAAGLPVYLRSGFILTPADVPVKISGDRCGKHRTIVAQRLVALDVPALALVMADAADFVRFDARRKAEVSIDAPAKVAAALLSRARQGRSRLRVLTGVINAPTLRADGSVLARAGYDFQAGLLFDPRGVHFPPIPDAPSKDHAAVALHTLCDLIQGFPFVSDVDRSAALCLLLTAVVRYALKHAPLHATTAPMPGTGKSCLADLGSVLATGREAGVIAQGSSGEETEKRLGALFLAGEKVICIDNCEHPLGGAYLNQALSQPLVRTRILGRSEAPELAPDALMTATGNNLVLYGDMSRRSLLCRLDAKMERPEEREFTFDPITVAKSERPALVAAALTVLRAYEVAGRPPQRGRRLAGFEVWTGLVRDALLWLGQADPVESQDEVRSLDPKAAVLKAVVANWRRFIGSECLTAKGIIDAAIGEGREEFYEALVVAAGRRSVLQAQDLGYWLRDYRDRIVMLTARKDEREVPAASFRIVQERTNRDGIAFWRLERLPT